MKKGILNTKNNVFTKGTFNKCFQYVPFCNVKRAVSSAETARFRIRFGTFCNILIVNNMLQRGFDLFAEKENNHRLTTDN